jgi:hypothetical protein
VQRVKQEIIMRAKKLKLLIKVCALSIQLITFSTTAFAGLGGMDGGGGDSIQDSLTKNRSLLDMVEKDQLEFFNPKLSYGDYSITNKMAAFIRAKDICHISQHGDCFINQISSKRFAYIFDIAYGFSQRLPISTGIFGQQAPIPKGSNYYLIRPSNSELKRRSDELRQAIQDGKLPEVKALLWAFTDIDLEELNDEGVIHLDDIATKKQVAIQKNNLVVISRQEFNKLDNESKDALFVHESVLYTVLKLNPKIIAEKGTEPVRTYVRQLVKHMDNQDLMLVYPVKQAYDSFEIKDLDF